MHLKPIIWYRFGINKEALTQIILVFWVTVRLRRCGLNGQFHCLDLILSTDETPGHWTTVSGRLWHLDVILRQQGQFQDTCSDPNSSTQWAAQRTSKLTV